MSVGIMWTKQPCVSLVQYVDEFNLFPAFFLYWVGSETAEQHWEIFRPLESYDPYLMGEKKIVQEFEIMI